MTPSITQRLKEMRELREKATDKSDFSMQSGFKNSDPNSSEVDFLVSHLCINVSADKEFYEAAANNWLTLITCLEKAVEALSLLDNQDRSKGYPTGKEWMLLLEKQDDALTEISELLQGKR